MTPAREVFWVALANTNHHHKERNDDESAKNCQSIRLHAPGLRQAQSAAGVHRDSRDAIDHAIDDPPVEVRQCRRTTNEDGANKGVIESIDPVFIDRAYVD